MPDAAGVTGYVVVNADGTNRSYGPDIRTDGGETTMLTDVYYVCTAPAIRSTTVGR
jgi:hypothetical protein